MTVGLFSSSLNIQVGTNASRAIEDDVLPNSTLNGAIRRLFSPSARYSVTDYVMEELYGSLGVTAEKMFRYAQTDYAYGCPRGTFISSRAAEPVVDALLTAQEGQALTLNYYHFGQSNYLHTSWVDLITNHGYNPATNILGNLSATTFHNVYLVDIQIQVGEYATRPDPKALQTWGRSPKAGFTSSRSALAVRGHTLTQWVQGTEVVNVKVLTTYKVSLTDPAVQGSFNLTLPVSAGQDYHMAKYTLDGSGVEKYWTYLDNSTTYPTIDSIFNPPAFSNGTYFPFTYFRFAKTSQSADPGSVGYLTNKAMIKKLGMNYDLVAAGIDENPDIADVEQAMLMFSVAADSTTEIEIRYLFAYFSRAFDNQPQPYQTVAAARNAALVGGNADLVENTIIIEDSRFKMALSNNGVVKKLIAGKVGIVGTYTSAFITETITQDYYNPSTEGVQSASHVVKTHIYRSQITTTTYEEVRVVNLRLLYYVYDIYTVLANETDDILLIPLDHALITDYTLAEREELYARALHYVFNSLVITKLAFYQTPAFGKLLFAIALFVTLVSLGGDGGAFMEAVIAWDLTAASVAAYALITTYVGALALAAGLKVVVKELGLENSLVLAVVTLIASAYLSKTDSVAGAPWAARLMQLSSGLSSSVQTVSNDLMQDVRKDYETWLEQTDDWNKELEDAQALLNTSTKIDPFVILGEAPEDFYNRTVHTPNIGVLAIDAIHTFVDQSLSLPKTIPLRVIT
jgi:hypothetical protein